MLDRPLLDRSHSWFAGCARHDSENQLQVGQHRTGSVRCAHDNHPDHLPGYFRLDCPLQAFRRLVRWSVPVCPTPLTLHPTQASRSPLALTLCYPTIRLCSDLHILCGSKLNVTINRRCHAGTLNADYSQGICIKGSPANACGPCYGAEANCGNSNTQRRYCQTSARRAASKCCARYQWQNSGTCVQKTGYCASQSTCGECDGVWTGGSSPYTGCTATQRATATKLFVDSVADVSCDFSLQTIKCDGSVSLQYRGVTFNGGSTVDLKDDRKQAADTMIALGSMCIIFLFVNLCINIVILVDKFSKYHNYMGIAAMVLCLVAWIFLMAGWAHYADKKGGVPFGSVSYGASFAFSIIIWLALFPYSFFWLVLWNQIDEPDSEAHQGCDGVDGSQPNSGACRLLTTILVLGVYLCGG